MNEHTDFDDAKNVIYTNSAIFQLVDNNIISISYKENTNIELADSIENDLAGKSLMQPDMKYGVLVNALPFFSFTAESREFEMNNSIKKYEQIKAIAILVDHLHIRIIAKFILKFHEKNELVRSKIFSNQTDALSWLRNELENEGD